MSTNGFTQNQNGSIEIQRAKRRSTVVVCKPQLIRRHSGAKLKLQRRGAARLKLASVGLSGSRFKTQVYGRVLIWFACGSIDNSKHRKKARETERSGLGRGSCTKSFAQDSSGTGPLWPGVPCEVAVQVFVVLGASFWPFLWALSKKLYSSSRCRLIQPEPAYKLSLPTRAHLHAMARFLQVCTETDQNISSSAAPSFGNMMCQATLKQLRSST